MRVLLDCSVIPKHVAVCRACGSHIELEPADVTYQKHRQFDSRMEEWYDTHKTILSACPICRGQVHLSPKELSENFYKAITCR